MQEPFPHQTWMGSPVRTAQVDEILKILVITLATPMEWVELFHWNTNNKMWEMALSMTI